MPLLLKWNLNYPEIETLVSSVGERVGPLTANGSLLKELPEGIGATGVGRGGRIHPSENTLFFSLTEDRKPWHLPW